MDNIQSMFTDAIKNKIKLSFLLLLDNVMYNDNETTVFEKNNSLVCIENYIKDFTINLNLTQENRTLNLEKANNFKNTILDISNCLLLYIYKSEMLISYYDFLDVKILIDHELKNNINIDELFNDDIILKYCHDFINTIKKEDAHNKLNRNIKAAHVMSIFPLEMDNLQYADYILNSIINCDKLGYKLDIGYLISSFHPESNSLYGKYYTNIKDTLEEFDKTQIDFNNAILIDDTLNQIVDFKNDIYNFISHYLNHLLECLNSIIILCNFCDDCSFLFDDDLKTKDVYYTFKQYNCSIDGEFILDSNQDNLDEIIEMLIDEIALDENTLNMYEDDTKILSSSLNLINILLYDNLIKDKNQFGTCSNSLKSLKNLFKDLYTEKDNLKQMIIKQSFLKKIPCFYINDQIDTYFKESMHRITDKSLKYIIYNLIKDFKENSKL